MNMTNENLMIMKICPFDILLILKYDGKYTAALALVNKRNIFQIFPCILKH